LPSSPIQCRYGIVGLSQPAPRPIFPLNRDAPGPTKEEYRAHVFAHAQKVRRRCAKRVKAWPGYEGAMRPAIAAQINAGGNQRSVLRIACEHHASSIAATTIVGRRLAENSLDKSLRLSFVV
jgi:hypothetical protein